MDRPPILVRVSRLGQRLRRMSPWAIDALVATGLLLITLPSIWARHQGSYTYREPKGYAIALALLAVLPFYFRRRAPLATFVAATVPVLALNALHFQVATLAQALLIGMYSIAAYSPSRQRLIGALWIAAALLFARATAPDLSNSGLAFNATLFVAAYLFGATVRNRRNYTDELEARAIALEHERDEKAKRAVSDERLRIAQELHDVVAHSMGVIAVQAGVGAHVIDDDPAEAKHALEAIASTSRTTLNEIRRLLGVLRDDGAAAYQPAPGLADLDRLVTDVGAAGLSVSVHTERDGARSPDEVPPGVELTAYRIVQEALTNVLKHAGPATAEVRLAYTPGALHVEVTDDGRGVNGSVNGEGGHGLLGMRERVAVYGGTLSAGPRAGGGFRVVAQLPYGGAE